MSSIPNESETHGAPGRGVSAPAQPRRTSPVWWVIAVSLAVIAFALATRSGTITLQSVLAQPTTGAGAGGVFAFSGQLSKGSYGIFLVDVDAGTIWTYEYVAAKRCLRLAAARSWRYDRYLEDFNTCDLPPEVVEQMVDEQRRQQLESIESDVP
ncbi:MAG: hypothetical protein IH988_11995 [Planctomycetes bacterium]|nr:hypothetical protein [Planctomycetota bacterium]